MTMLQKKIWETLSKVNVNEHVERKGNLSYLSWAWAWGTMMEHYPTTDYAFELEKFDDGTVQVTANVTISEGEQSVTRFMWLPVMDYKNKAIKHPDAFAINTAKMRCLTKCFAMFGLGHYIYAGEDTPQAMGISQEQVDQLVTLIKETDSDITKFLKVFKVQQIDDLDSNQFEQAHKMLVKKLEQK